MKGSVTEQRDEFEYFPSRFGGEPETEAEPMLSGYPPLRVELERIRIEREAMEIYHQEYGMDVTALEMLSDRKFHKIKEDIRCQRNGLYVQTSVG